MKKELSVSEIFYSIQGEGQTMGIPAVFLRLSGCNLLCKGEGWICDSIKVWKKGVKTPFEDVICPDYIEKLHQGAHLVITGGEPMLHRKAIERYIKWFEVEHNFKPIIEIETNGTISLEPYLEKKVDYWNVSPKLESSGESKKKRFNELSLFRLNRQGNVIFKFVISKKEDALEVFNEFDKVIDFKNVVFMPAGENQAELEITRPIAAQLSVDMCVRYSDRLHIVIWNLKTGV